MSAPTPHSSPAVHARGTVGDIVAEFIEEKKKDRATQEMAAVPKRNRKLMGALLGVLALSSWLVPFPSPTEPGPIHSEVRAAGVRMEVFMAAQRVRRYRAEHGRLPPAPSDAGIDENWITMRPLDTVEFEVTGRVDGQEATYRSTMSDSAFLGSARTMLGGAAL